MCVLLLLDAKTVAAMLLTSLNRVRHVSVYPLSNKLSKNVPASDLPYSSPHSNLPACAARPSTHVILLGQFGIVSAYSCLALAIKSYMGCAPALLCMKATGGRVAVDSREGYQGTY